MNDGVEPRIYRGSDCGDTVGDGDCSASETLRVVCTTWYRRVTGGLTKRSVLHSPGFPKVVYLGRQHSGAGGIRDKRSAGKGLEAGSRVTPAVCRGHPKRSELTAPVRPCGQEWGEHNAVATGVVDDPTALELLASDVAALSRG